MISIERNWTRHADLCQFMGAIQMRRLVWTFPRITSRVRSSLNWDARKWHIEGAGRRWASTGPCRGDCREMRLKCGGIFHCHIGRKSWGRKENQYHWSSEKTNRLWNEWRSIQFSRSVVSDSLWPKSHITNSRSLLKFICPLSQWYHPTISSSVIPFSSCLQSFPVSGSFLMSQLFSSGGQRIGASTLASILPMNVQDWFPLGLTGLISVQSKSLLQHHSSKASVLQHSTFFMVQLSHTYMTTGKNHSFDYMDLCQQSNVSSF